MTDKLPRSTDHLLHKLGNRFTDHCPQCRDIRKDQEKKEAEKKARRLAYEEWEAGLL